MDVYFDNNALKSFFAHPRLSALQLEVARDRKRERVNDGNVTVLYSLVLIEELLGLLPRREKYDRMFAFLFDVGQFNLVHPDLEDLARIEIQRGGRLEGNDRFAQWTYVRDVRIHCRRGDGLEVIPAQTRDRKQAFLAKQEELRQRYRARVQAEGRRPAAGARAWWGDAERQIEDWTLEFLTNNRHRLGLGEAQAEWPAPGRIHSLWRYYAYRMALIYLNNTGQRQPVDSDEYDTQHYVAGSYADVLVTEDGGFRETAAAIPVHTPRVLPFEEFVRTELGVA